jgi:hypothetical protein
MVSSFGLNGWVGFLKVFFECDQLLFLWFEFHRLIFLDLSQRGFSSTGSRINVAAESSFSRYKKNRGAKIISTEAIISTQIPRWCRIDISNGLP